MTTLVYVIAYIGIVFFLIAVVARFVFWSKMPMHLRWELYPVAHEGGGRAAYGGSYLEESDWWKKKREVSLLGELKVMVPEILFLVALREHNRKLWTWSFPFHFGLYLVAATTILLLVGGIAGALLPANAAAPINTVIGFVAPWLGGAGLVLGIVGALGLFAWWRGGAAVVVVRRPVVTVDRLHPDHPHVSLRRQVLRLPLDSLERRPQPAGRQRGEGDRRAAQSTDLLVR
ncbi:MAG: hypothetical protein IFK92_13665 [Acidobacteria bacterium]|nr:hypothetical protein [Candidatus Sulfomarinibacter kjeldsenii]